MQIFYMMYYALCVSYKIKDTYQNHTYIYTQNDTYFIDNHVSPYDYEYFTLLLHI